jgi:cytochrome P450
LQAISWAVGLGLYNVYLHPLRRFPGPKLWAAYWIPYTWSNLQGRLSFNILEFHRKYGPVVRIAPNHLVFTDPKAWDAIYGMQPGRVQNKKDVLNYTPLQQGWESKIIYADDAMHARLRRIYGPAFTAKAVEEQSGMLMKYANLLIAQLKSAIAKDSVQDMCAWYNFTTFDLIGDLAFGEAFQCLDRGGEYHFVIRTIFNGVKIGLQMGQLQRYGLLSLIRPLIPKSSMKSKIDMDQYTKDVIDRRMKRGYDPKTNDVFNYLLRHKDKRDQLTDDELYENGLTIVVAGSETTATLLTGVTWFLCKNPDALRRVQREVRTAFNDDGEITAKSVNELPYMLAVLSEGLRIFPPTGFPMARIVAVKGGQEIAGHYVPEKVSQLLTTLLSSLTFERRTSRYATTPRTATSRTSRGPMTSSRSGGSPTRCRSLRTTRERSCSRSWWARGAA